MNWLIKLLGGYTSEEYDTKYRQILVARVDLNRILWSIGSQREKLVGALISAFSNFGHTPEECHSLAKHYSEDILERMK